MSKSIMSGIMKETGKKLEKDIAKKLVIKNVNVSFRNGNLNVSVNPKDEDAVSGDDKKKFDDLCNKFFEQAVSEYFAEN